MNPHLDPNRERAAIRALNRFLGLPGIPAPSLEFDAVVRRSERLLGLDDWGGADYHERLRFTLECLAGGEELSPLGHVSAAIIHGWHAANRLRIVDYVKRNPDVLEVPIERPVFIVGWFRTGTTNLHNLLSLDSNVRVPLAWELCYPVPESDDPIRDKRRRYRRTARKWGLGEWISPHQKEAHELRPGNSEECIFPLANTGVLTEQIMALGGYDYARDLLKQSMKAAYRDLRVQYQILTTQSPENRRWVFKCPLHLWFLDDLLEVFPDARIIQTHRAAASAIPSVSSLSAIMCRPFTKNFRPERHGTFFKEFCRAGIDRSMSVRPQIPNRQLLDIRLGDLDQDPVGTVRRIYQHFRMNWDEEVMPSRIVAHLHDERERRRRRLGPERKHRYTAEQYGLSDENLTSEFADYESVFL
jgi:hypothetical protein